MKSIYSFILASIVLGSFASLAADDYPFPRPWYWGWGVDSDLVMLEPASADKYCS